MMYLVELEREIELQPCFFGPRLREVLEQKLHSEVDVHTLCVPHNALHMYCPGMNWAPEHHSSGGSQKSKHRKTSQPSPLCRLREHARESTASSYA